MSPTVQIIMGLIICFILLMSVGFFFTSPQKEVNNIFDEQDDYVGGQTYRVPIIEGVLPFSESEIVISTSNAFASQYVKLPRSNNLEGGAQFSYSFWINREDTRSDNVAEKVIFLRGLTQKMKVMTPGDIVANNIPGTSTMIVGDNMYSVANSEEDSLELMVKCPLVRFGKDVHELVIEFNSLQQYKHSIPLSLALLENSVNNWVMVTITFEDTVDMYGNAKGVMFRAYINDTEAVSGTVSSDALRINSGPIYVMPSLNSTDNSDSRQTLKGSVADITYFNYALGQDEVKDLYMRGFNSGTYKTPSDRKASALKSKYYRLSLSSELEQI
jgi:hypothetical protein